MQLLERVAESNQEGEVDMKKEQRCSDYKYLLRHDSDVQMTSRKTKKRILGRKMSNRKLKERLSLVVVTERKYPEPALISDRFCPKCGCDATTSTGNMAEYPELWVKEFCLRCGFLVAIADNSPRIHCLELSTERNLII